LGGAKPKCFTTAAIAIALGVLAVAGRPLYAEDYPVRPIHLIVGFPAGSIADVAFRVVSAKMSEKLGLPIVVED
jgi:tripartite-type tricarboxylate transporter receptor subunit TctC